MRRRRIKRRRRGRRRRLHYELLNLDSNCFVEGKGKGTVHPRPGHEGLKEE